MPGSTPVKPVRCIEVDCTRVNTETGIVTLEGPDVAELIEANRDKIQVVTKDQ